MAEVYLARQEGMAGFKRLAVIKRILPQFSASPSVAEMLLDEARIAAQLNHPNIVQIFELGQEEGQYFIVLEYVDGADLATLARIERHRQSRVPLQLTLRIITEAATGLEYAHNHVGLDGRPSTSFTGMSVLTTSSAADKVSLSSRTLASRRPSVRWK